MHAAIDTYTKTLACHFQKNSRWFLSGQKRYGGSFMTCLAKTSLHHIMMYLLSVILYII